ncbi:hypothetical protein [Granulosicoccus antarcticus]|uniref:Uncharacterized protein n=1 Tax=Granulosicoccus antarcticus IMCC3135 TaxID=1192854 RepID=A0A2Z2P1A4_9GAMM|nr:hypothetical protein [Granulosicoccus antarcticus]ASJ74990.1 hypothetical protein IMCC3135_24620 [Granulosicoccus antarcticus IMCC3135]
MQKFHGKLLLAAGVLFAAQVVNAAPTVVGNIISWPDDGWYQVQSPYGAIIYCNGGSSCEVGAGRYKVINHTTGESFSDVVVGGEVVPVNGGVWVVGDVITWPDNGWYQVQSTNGATTYCNGGSSCQVDPGSYLVVNHTTGERFSGINVIGEEVPGDADIRSGNGRIFWPDNGWYQVQSIDGATTYCSGGSSCDVSPGSYLVINHTTGERFDNIVVKDDVADGDPSRIQVEGNVISWPDDGWYEVQGIYSTPTYCEGGRSCTMAEAGQYIVINHTTGERFVGVTVASGASAPESIDVEGLVDEYYTMQNLKPFKLIEKFAIDVLQKIDAGELDYIKYASDGSDRPAELTPDFNGLSIGQWAPSLLDYRFECPEGGYFYTSKQIRDEFTYFADCRDNGRSFSGAFSALNEEDFPRGVTFYQVDYRDEAGTIEASALDYSAYDQQNSMLVLGMRADYPSFPKSIVDDWVLQAARSFNESTGEYELTSSRMNADGFESAVVSGVAFYYGSPPEVLVPAGLTTVEGEQFYASGFNGQYFQDGGATISVGNEGREFVLNYSASDAQTLQVDEYVGDGSVVSHQLARKGIYDSEELSAQSYNPFEKELEFIYAEDFLP